MVIVSREQVVERFRELGLMKPMLQSVQTGWDRFQKKIAPAFKEPTARARATNVHDLISEALEASTRGIDGVHFSRKGDRHWLHVGTDIIVEIHKLNEDLVASRNQTEFAETLRCQQLENGLGEVLALTLGYTHDDLGAELRKVLVVCAQNDKLRWDIDLKEEARAEVVVEFPKRGTAAGTAKQRRAKPKAGAKKATKENGEDKS